MRIPSGMRERSPFRSTRFRRFSVIWSGSTTTRVPVAGSTMKTPRTKMPKGVVPPAVPVRNWIESGLIESSLTGADS
jgi:hypothetical protein